MGHEQIVLVDAADGRQNGLKRGLALAKDAQVKGHVAERDFCLDGAPHDPRIGAVKSQGGDESQTESRDGASERERLVFMKELFEKRHIAREQSLAEVEELDFLGRGVFRQQPREVIDLPGFGRPAGEQSEAFFREARLRNESGDARGQENHHEPGTEAQQKHGKRDQGDRVLYDKESVVDQIHGLVTRLAAGVLQAVVKIRVFEESEIQGQRLANDLTANAVGELELNQLLDESARLIKAGAQ